MKIDVVAYHEGGYLVFFFPNWIERNLLGREPESKIYIPTGKYYVYTDLPSYYAPNGKMTGSCSSVAKAIERFKHSH